MGIHGCGADGKLVSDNFAGPLPVIGIYIAAASLLCFLAMALDLFYAVRTKKPWFPCRFFSINSASLTLLTIATKLPVDLNTPMPSTQDQLSKLSATVLICTVMANFMPSLGRMGKSELFSDVIAVAILVITVVVNICIQMATGVIYVYLTEHAIIMFLMLVLLVLFSFSALAVPISRDRLNEYYTFQSGRLLTTSTSFESMIEDAQKRWIMAYSSSHHHVLSSLETCNAAGVFSLLSALLLVEAIVRSVVIKSFFCSGQSDYKWSTWLILIIQVLAVVVGNVAPLGRWLNIIKGKYWNIREKLFVEEYSFDGLQEWKRISLLPFHIGNRKCRRIVHYLKTKFVDIVAGTYRVAFWVSKVIRLSPLMLITRWSHIKELPIIASDFWNQRDPIIDFVIHPNEVPYRLQHSNRIAMAEAHDLVPLILKSGRKDIDEWISRSNKNKPNHLIKLLQDKSTAPEGFRRALEFDSDDVPSISDVDIVYYFTKGQGEQVESKKVPNCWSLPVVTLTSIAISLVHSDSEQKKLLLQGVSEGLKFVNYVEKVLDFRWIRNSVKAARNVWIGIDLYDGRWLDVNLSNLVSATDDDTPFPAETIEKLAEIGERCVQNLWERINEDRQPEHWPVNVYAGSSLYRVCKTIIANRGNFPTKKSLVEWLEKTISDLLGDCLVNLPHIIRKDYSDNGGMEVRENSLRNAVCILLEAQHFQEILNRSPCGTNSHLFGTDIGFSHGIVE